MKVYTLDIDSGERDCSLWPTPNAYEIALKTPLHSAQWISLESARIPTSYNVINDNNNVFTVKIDAVASDGTTPIADAGSYDVDLTSREFANGTALANHVLSRIQAAGIETIDTVTWRGTRDSLKFSNAFSVSGSPNYDYTLLFRSGARGWTSNVEGSTTPNQVLGFAARDVRSSNGVIDEEGRVDFNVGPKQFVLRLSCGSEGFYKDAFARTPFYTGTIMNKSSAPGDQYVTYSSKEDSLIHEFTKAPHPCIESLRVEWFYKENNKLIPLDFRSRDHAIKLKIYATKDRLEEKPRIVDPHRIGELPPPISAPEFEERVYEWKEFIPIIFILVIGLVVTFSISGSRSPAGTAS